MKTEDRPQAPSRPRPVPALDRALLAIVGGRVKSGRLSVELPDGTRRAFIGRGDGPGACVRVHDPKLLRRLTTTGAIGLADGYVAGDYDTDNLAALIELAALHLEPGCRARVPEPLDRIGRAIWRVLGSASTPRGPLEDIVQHYDLGNDFYSQWLDPTMTYSSAVFARDEMSLEEAQREKYRRLAETAGIRSGHRVLEIGSGWGGFATYVAGEIGAHVTTLTISKEQAAYVEKLVADRGLVDQVDVGLRDFSAEHGTYDRIASIEMIESIPASRWAEYFAAVRDRLAPGGRAGLQIITVADHHWKTSDRNPDFIRRYVFPGGQVPAPMILRRLTAGAGLRWLGNHEYGRSYARTLRCWRERFDSQWSSIEAMGFDEPFRRMWRYYLSYCEGGFRVGRADVSQIALSGV